jgi:hypothetical protein
MSHDPQVNEEISHRVTMLILSVTLVVATMSMDGPLGWRSIFPLIAIWPGIAAFIGLQLAPWGKIFGETKASRARVVYQDVPYHA